MKLTNALVTDLSLGSPLPTRCRSDRPRRSSRQRGHAWHYRAEQQGDEPNHFPGAIPLEDVQRRLFGRTAQSRRVRPELVFLTGTLIPDVTIKQQPDDLLVLDRMDIPGAFRSAPHRLNVERIGEVYEHARRSTIWTRGVLDPSLPPQRKRMNRSGE